MIFRQKMNCTFIAQLITKCPASLSGPHPAFGHLLQKRREAEDGLIGTEGEANDV